MICSEEVRMHITTKWLELIVKKEKPLEGKKAFGSWSFLQEGMTIIVHDNQREFYALITKINYYDTLESFLTTETIEKCLPGISTLALAKSIYCRFNIDKDYLNNHSEDQIKIKEEMVEKWINENGGMQAIYLCITEEKIK